MGARFLLFLRFVFTLVFGLSFVLAWDFSSPQPAPHARNRLPLVNAVIVDRGKL